MEKNKKKNNEVFYKSGRGYDNIITFFLSLMILKLIQECNNLNNNELQQNKGLLVWIRNQTWGITNWSKGPTREEMILNHTAATQRYMWKFL